MKQTLLQTLYLIKYISPLINGTYMKTVPAYFFYSLLLFLTNNSNISKKSNDKNIK